MGAQFKMSRLWILKYMPHPQAFYGPHLKYLSRFTFTRDSRAEAANSLRAWFTRDLRVIHVPYIYVSILKYTEYTVS
jgi:hypothetical protein